MANKTVTVRESGGDYTGIQAAITGEVAANANLTAAGMDGILTISVEGTWTNPETNRIVITGFTVDASHYVNIVCVGDAKHTGKKTSTAYRNERNQGYQNCIEVVNQYTRIRGVQFANLAANTYGIIATGGYCQIIDCICYGAGIRGFAFNNNSDLPVYIINCIAINSVNGFEVVHTHSDAYLYNCVSVNNSGIGFLGRQYNGVFVLKNCYAGGNTGADYSNGSGGMSVTTCFSEDGTLSTTVAAWSTDNFTNVTAGSEDVSLVAGSDLIDEGTDLSGDATFPFDYDIIDVTRSAPWEVGAFEFSSGGEYDEASDDGLTFADTNSNALSIFQTIADGTEITDTSENNIFVQSANVDGLTFSDSNISVLYAYTIGSDGLISQDNNDASLLIYNTVSDGISIADLANVTAILGVISSDGITFYDASTTGSFLNILASDGIKTSDLIQLGSVLNLSASDAIISADSVLSGDVAVGKLTVEIESKKSTVAVYLIRSKVEIE